MLHMSLAWITEQQWIKQIKIILPYAVLVKKKPKHDVYVTVHGRYNTEKKTPEGTSKQNKL